MESNTIAVKRGKNSIVELLRFLFSLWVLYFHDYVPYRNNMFSDGKLAVEFFFVLSGFYLVRSMKKYDSQPVLKGLGAFLKQRFKSLSAVFIIGEIFVLIYSLGFDFSYNFMFGYLWYVRDLFIAMAFFFILRRVLKKDGLFYSTVAILSIFSIFISGKIPGFAEWPGGALRALAAMPLGMLFALIPRLPKTAGGKLASVLGFIAVGALTLSIVAAPDKTQLMLYILVIAGYPALLYFANQIDISVGFLNWLGTLSFPIYAFQCILRVIEQFGVENPTHHFVIITALVLSYSAITTVVSKQKSRKTLK